MRFEPHNITANVTLPGYCIESLLFDSAPTRIYRATRDSDGLRVILKSHNGTHIVSGTATCLRHEYEIARRFSSPGVIQVYELENCRNVPVMVMEDFGGESLDNLIGKHRFSVEEILKISLAITKGLAEVHAQEVIHKDLTPANIVYNAESGIVKIIDFGTSSHLTPAQAAISDPHIIAVSLPYISPEQTGRMNRSIDYRSDYYSLGASLYELITGQKLFDADEPIEWFHCHIAKQPTPAYQLNSDIPIALSNIVMKLLGKMAEDRYQSAWGIQADLQCCLEQLQKSGRIETFPLARHDVPNRFHIPQRLYGREKETQELLQSFENACMGKSEILFVSGYSGIGKSCLIRELYKPITKRKGYFVSGKFDQLHRNIPYSALIIALRDLVKQLLTESETRLEQWKYNILEALGGNARLIADIVHELELIIGPQPKVQELPPAEAEQRFLRVFLNFIQVFSDSSHPLVIFLDDLQWADMESLRILEHLLKPELATSHLLVIGSFRDNEVNAFHPFKLLLNEFNDKQVNIRELQLNPLDENDLTKLIADTLHSDTESVRPLAQLVEEKTAGNPFFVEEFLKFLLKKELIGFNYTKGSWEWNLDGIRAQAITDNVVGLMRNRVNGLPEKTLELLRIAACIGGRFDLKVISIVSGSSPNDVFQDLKPAIKDSIIAPTHDVILPTVRDSSLPTNLKTHFAFCHDRILQAVYELLSETERRLTHLNIGRLLLKRLSENERDEQIFEITNHLNAGLELIKTADERAAALGLNIEAGKRANASSAYQAAFSYFSTALKLLPDNSWHTQYDLTFDLFVHASEAASLKRDYATMDRLLDIALKATADPVDEARLYKIKVMALQAQGRLRESIDTAKRIMAKLGHKYPKTTSKRHIIAKLLKVIRKLHNRTVEELLDHPQMEDPKHLIASSIGSQIGRAAMFVEPHLLPNMVLYSLINQIEYGYATDALPVWAAYGMIVSCNLNKPKKGVQYAQLALELTKKFHAPCQTARVMHIYNAMIRHWNEPLANSLQPLHEAYRLSLDNGDFEYAGLAVAVRQFDALYAGQTLQAWKEDTLRYQETVGPLRQGMTADYLDVCLQLSDNLQGKAPDPKRLVGEYYNIIDKNEIHLNSGDISFLVVNREMSVWLNYLFRDNTEALNLVNKMRTYSGSFGGFFGVATNNMLESLVLLGNLAGFRGKARRTVTRRISRNQKKLERWSEHCPQNFRNKYLLVEAEKCRRYGNDFDAHELYEQSMAIASEQGFVHEQAIAAELCGEMHFEAGKYTLADPYLKKARDLYQQWGATAKVTDIEERYPHLLDSVSVHTGTTSQSIVNFDITALTKTLKAIASESNHKLMIQTVLESALEFAGAQKGCLVLRDAEGSLCVEAQHSLDGRTPELVDSLPVERGDLPQNLINYVIRTQKSIVIHDAQKRFEAIAGLKDDPYFINNAVRSIMCMAITSGNNDPHELIGFVYLENNLASGTFTQERFDTLEIIGMAAAGRLELTRKATFDGLTGLVNYDQFQYMLDLEISNARRHQHDLALLFIDIDHFKQFNDTWGHQLGDLVLRDVAQLIKAACRNADVVARYGGEELSVILPSTSRNEAMTIAERIRQTIEQHKVDHQGEKLSVTVSMGLAMFDPSNHDKNELIRLADLALYRSKGAGRNRLSAD